MPELNPANTLTFKKSVKLFDPARIFSRDVVVAPATPGSGSAVDTPVSVGMLLVSDGAGKYNPIAFDTDISAAVPTGRVAVLVEDGTAAVAGTTLRAIVSGRVFIAGLVNAGYDKEKIPVWALEEIGGRSNITFVDEEEI